MKSILVSVLMTMIVFRTEAQPLQLLDRFNGNKVVNDSIITVFSSEAGIPELTQYFTMKNNTDRPLALFLRKTVLQMSDSTTDYFCFGVKCWPGSDTTDIADTIPPGGEDYTFASHVCHIRRFDIPQPPLPPGKSIITYTVYDHTSFTDPIEASVTVIYHLSALGMRDLTEQHVVVYPNPATGILSLAGPFLLDGPYRLSVFNANGTAIISQDVIISGKYMELTVKNLPAGMYFGVLISGKGRPLSFRFTVVD